MVSYLISESDIAGLNNFRVYLERYPGLIEGFLKNLGLPSLDSGTQQTLVNIVTRAKRDAPVWPDLSEQLRNVHKDVTLFINDFSEIVTQLKLYKRPEETDPIRENLNTLALHAAPYNLNGKLGISPTSKTSDLLYRMSTTLNSFDYVIADATLKMKRVQDSTSDIIPRTTDFMKVKIGEHEARHRKPDGSFPESVRKQLETTNSNLESSKTEYSSAIEAANNLHAYCTRLRQLLSDAKGQLLLISDLSNVRTFLLQMNLMDTRLNQAHDLVKRGRDLL